MEAFALLGIVAALVLLSGSVMGIIAMVQLGGLQRTVRTLQRTVTQLTARLDAVEAAEALQRPAEEAPAAPVPEPPAPEPETPRPEAPPQTPPQPPPPPPRPRAAARARTSSFSLEQHLTSKWMVWVGGLALALGAVFLVIYAIERAYFGPELRVLGGLALGLALLGLGEWVRRHPAMAGRVGIGAGADYVSQALAAAGLVGCFAAIYGAHALYGLIGAPLAFVALALFAFLGVALALLQGPFVAILGLLGGYVTPLLIATAEPNAWALFPYLLALTAASLAVARYVTSWWLIWSALGGTIIWPFVWLGEATTRAYAPSGASMVVGQPIAEWILPFGLYLIAVSGLFQFLRLHPADPDPASRSLWSRPPWPWVADRMPGLVAWTATVIFAVLMAALVIADFWGWVSLMLFAALVGWSFVFAVWEERYAGVALWSAAVAAFVMVAWPLAGTLTWTPGQAIPAELSGLLGWCLAYGAFFGLAGYWAVGRGGRPAIWALLSGLGPVLFLTVAYRQVSSFETDYIWPLPALLLGFIGLAATAQWIRRPALAQHGWVVGLYAAATVTAFSLALTMALEEAWLTVALSGQLPILAWIAKRKAIPALAPIAGAVAAIVLIRLIPNVLVLQYDAAGTLGIPWVVYGYGLPALAFYLTRRLFADLAILPGRTVRGVELGTVIRAVLEAGAIAFGVILVSLVVRLLVEGRLDAGTYSLAEQSLQQAAWAAAAALLWVVNRTPRLVVTAWAWRLLLLLAAAHSVLGPLIADNPLVTGTPVGRSPVINLLFLAYALPAAFAFLFGSIWKIEGAPLRARVANIAGLGYAFVYLMLEVRRAYQGPVLWNLSVTDAELYAYSAVLLIFALGLLAVGLVTRRPGPRHASLAFMIATVAKVFLIDMSALTGLYRVASFLGLGFALIGLGWIYQRFVLSGTATGSPPEPPEPT